ncbi:MAG: 6-phosphofructokinase [Anaerolineae bacterium]|nr:6-phosphofructokinase [Anaerolineae bacterium]
MKKVAVLTSGGDAPGMNAAIRSVVRCGLDKGWEMYGVRQGYQGLINGLFVPMGARDVGGIIQKGGTILGSARCLEFKTIEGQKKGIRQLNQAGIDGLIVIGGNGSQSGACALANLGYPVVGVSSTIDNDLYGCDITIGVDTAMNIVLEAIDRIKITASSHQRAFLIEVMGRDCGYLALMCGIAGGAEMVVIPEVDIEPGDVAKVIDEAYEKGKSHAIILVAEGAKYNASMLQTFFRDHKEELGFSIRVTILGHVQRGGNPTAFDRLLASRLGAAAVERLAGGETGVMVGLSKGEYKSIPLTDVVANKKTLDLKMVELARKLD